MLVKQLHAMVRTLKKIPYQKPLPEILEEYDDFKLLDSLLRFVPETKGCSESLTERFQQLDRVFSATYEELRNKAGLTEQEAFLIKLVQRINRRCLILQSGEAGEELRTGKAAGRFITPYFYGERDEVVYIISTNARNRVISHKQMFRGDFNAVTISIRKIVEKAIADNASGIIIAHNHVNGSAVPSAEDIDITKRLEQTLNAIGVNLNDHIVVANNSFISMRDSGYFL